ncbi:MAG: hypothetical protein J6B37_07095 [Clostridia bacterium]|nr:hypothetical protein [Clostridia bacterium]
MKKVIALLLVAVMVFSFAACNKDKEDETPTAAPIDKEVLKQGWQEGVLTFANGKSVTLPCSIVEIIEASELTIPALDSSLKDATLESGMKKSLNLVNSETSITLKCENSAKEAIKLGEATVIGYTINRTKEGNAKVKFANTLTVNAGKTDVEEVLGADETAEKKGFSKYQGTNSKKEKVEMRVTYDSNNLVNSVAFEIK